MNESLSRRDILRRSIVLLSPFILNQKPFYMAWMDFSSRRSVIFFPEGKSFSDFQTDLPQWMNVKTWLAFLEEQKASGALLGVERQVTSNFVAYEYKFRSLKDRIFFEEAALHRCQVNLKARKNLGYSDHIV